MCKEEILRMIEEDGVEFIRLQFTDIFGILKNIAVTPGQMEKVFNNKFSFDGSAVFGSRYCYDDKLYLYPDLSTFMILPWRPQQGKVAKIICDVCYQDGAPFELSTRYILKETVKKVEEKGYSVIADPECEFFLFHTDENGLPTTTSHEMAGYMDVGPADFGENARRDIILMLEDMGFDIESSHHEHAPAQHEIDFSEEEAIKMADSIQTFKFAVRSIAKRFGLYATFMPKPKMNAAGSGMHINLKLVKNGKNVFRGEDGKETKEARYFVGGIMAHAKALAAIANPTVNSYKRLFSGYDAPNMITWDTKGEKTLVKLIKETDDIKIELRFPDGSSNPYLLFSSCIMAGLDGIEKQIEPGKEYSEVPNRKFSLLPEDLKEAIGELKKDKVVIESLGEEFTKIYSEVKLNEWREYMKEVSVWELGKYLAKI